MELPLPDDLNLASLPVGIHREIPELQAPSLLSSV